MYTKIRKHLRSEQGNEPVRPSGKAASQAAWRADGPRFVTLLSFPKLWFRSPTQPLTISKTLKRFTSLSELGGCEKFSVDVPDSPDGLCGRKATFEEGP